MTEEKRRIFEVLKKFHNFNKTPKEDKSLKLSSIFDIFSLSKDELKDQYYSFKDKLQDVSFGSRVILFEGEAVQLSSMDNVKSTLPVSDTISEMIKLFHLKSWQIKKKIAQNNVEIILLIPCSEENEDAIGKAMNTCGYFFSRYNHERINDVDWECMLFHPVFSTDVTKELLSNPYKFLFHLSPEYNKESILNNGIIAKSENFVSKYPDRIYVIEYVNEEQMRKIVNNLSFLNIDERNTGLYCAFQILKERLPKDLKFYFDPDTELGYYTYTNIPVEAITLSGTIRTI